MTLLTHTIQAYLQEHHPTLTAQYYHPTDEIDIKLPNNTHIIIHQQTQRIYRYHEKITTDNNYNTTWTPHTLLHQLTQLIHNTKDRP